jgi:hypothetical protein
MDAVERQVEAYNAGDVDAFVACYAEEVAVEDAGGNVQANGREQLREDYAKLFERCPDLRAEISTRIRVGPYVVDEERVSGHPAGDFHVVAVYRLDDEGLIDRVRFLR